MILGDDMEGLASILDIDGGYFLDLDGVLEYLVEGILDGIDGIEG